MKSQILLKPPYHYRPKTAYLFGTLAVLFVAGMCAVQVNNHGIIALATGCWGWYLLAYVACYFLAYPSVTVDAQKITIRNPLVTSELSYSVIMGLDTQYQLTLTSRRRKYKVLGAPASGVLATDTCRAMMTDMGGAVYRGESLTQVSGGGVAGDAGRMIAGYLKELRESGDVEKIPSHETRKLEFIGSGIFLLLLILFVAFSLS